MNFNFAGKKALVTGAAQGIGLAVMKKLAASGAEVVAIDIKGDQLRQVVKETPGTSAVVLDVGDWKATSEAMKKIGLVHLVVNNAAHHPVTPISDMTEEDVDRSIDVNLKAAMVICQYAMKELTSSGEIGSVVNVISVGSTRPLIGLAAYGASKAALLQFTRSLALEYGPQGIRVNSVSPGLTRTEMAKKEIEDPEIFAQLSQMIPMKTKIAEPEDVANAVLFLLSEEHASKITGVDLPVDAGFKLT